MACYYSIANMLILQIYHWLLTTIIIYEPNRNVLLENVVQTKFFKLVVTVFND